MSLEPRHDGGEASVRFTLLPKTVQAWKNWQQQQKNVQLVVTRPEPASRLLEGSGVPMSAAVLFGKLCHQDVNRKLVALCSNQLPSEATLETREDVLDRSRSGTTLEQQKTEGRFSTGSEHLGPERPKAPTTTEVTSALNC